MYTGIAQHVLEEVERGKEEEMEEVEVSTDS
jgi:hypothetical protein